MRITSSASNGTVQTLRRPEDGQRSGLSEVAGEDRHVGGERFGRVGFPLFYLASGLAADALHALTTRVPQLPILGASGAVSGAVVERYKYIRAGFLTSVLNADSHWLDRPIVPNLLEPGADIFAAGSEGPHP